MKQAIRSIVTCAAISAVASLAHAEMSRSFQLAENTFSTADEVNVPPSQDPNSENFVPDDAFDVKSVEAAPTPAPAPIAKPATPAAKPLPPTAPLPPRDIPLIETRNDESSHVGVTYVTGGIGDDEREAIEAAKADYNLHITSASNSGAFVGDARVIITSKAGEEMLSVAAGPLLYVRLPAGSYVLDATLGEQKKHQNFTVAKKGQPVLIRMGWKVASGN